MRLQQSMYTFPSPPPDTSDLLSELEEFYSYVEVSQVIEHKDSFIEAWPHSTGSCCRSPSPRTQTDVDTAEFIKTPKELQLAFIQELLDGLSSSDPDTRFNNARHLLYIAQGASPPCPLPFVLTKRSQAPSNPPPRQNTISTSSSPTSPSFAQSAPSNGSGKQSKLPAHDGRASARFRIRTPRTRRKVYRRRTGRITWTRSTASSRSILPCCTLWLRCIVGTRSGRMS